MIRFAVVSILGFSSIEKHDAVQGFCFSDSKGGGYFHRQSSQVTKLGAVGAPTCENDENKGSAQHQPPKKEQTRGCYLRAVHKLSRQKQRAAGTQY
mmetsp:Transcript_33943/g.50350  ORF Transcript_33943/g.50350 Transcript_33943/m.50350 type:complete len:96 (+) Transcript_33943:986-1273(+)